MGALEKCPLYVPLSRGVFLIFSSCTVTQERHLRGQLSDAEPAPSQTIKSESLGGGIWQRTESSLSIHGSEMKAYACALPMN